MGIVTGERVVVAYEAIDGKVRVIVCNSSERYSTNL